LGWLKIFPALDAVLAKPDLQRAGRIVLTGTSPQARRR